MSNRIDAQKLMSIVAFKVLDREYGVDILQIKEVIRARKITPVPEAPDFIEGVIILRGRVMPLVNLRKKFGIEAKAISRKSRIIVVQVESHVIGVIVDEVTDVLGVREESVTAPDEVLQEAKYLRGLVNLDKRLIILVDMVKLLTQEESAGVHKVYQKVEVRRRS